MFLSMLCMSLWQIFIFFHQLISYKITTFQEFSERFIFFLNEISENKSFICNFACTAARIGALGEIFVLYHDSSVGEESVSQDSPIWFLGWEDLLEKE